MNKGISERRGEEEVGRKLGKREGERTSTKIILKEKSTEAGTLSVSLTVSTSIFFYFGGTGLELRDSCLLGKCFIT